MTEEEYPATFLNYDVMESKIHICKKKTSQEITALCGYKLDILKALVNPEHVSDWCGKCFGIWENQGEAYKK